MLARLYFCSVENFLHYRSKVGLVFIKKNKDIKDRKRQDMQDKNQSLYQEYIADLVVEEKVIIELKCCDSLRGEHQAQLINYLKVSNILVGFLINFQKRMLEYKRVHHPDHHAA